MSNASRKKQSGHSGKFNAFIIPMIVILGILPLIIHLKIYDTNLEDQAYFLEETYPDIFLYYKSLIFIIICTAMLILTIARAVVRTTQPRIGVSSVGGDRIICHHCVQRH